MNSINMINNTIKKDFLNLSLPMTIHLVYKHLHTIYPEKSSKELYEHIEFKSNPSLSFQKSEISDVTFIKFQKKTIVQIEINFLGLLGTATPLPMHYAEEVLGDSQKEMILLDFLNLFNHHLQKFIYSIWRRQRYYIRYEEGLKDDFSKYILSILGLYSEQNHKDFPLKLNKFLPFTGMINMKKRPTRAIIPIIKNYIKHKDISINEYIISTANVPDWQKNLLGEKNSTLGENILIGNFATVCNLKFRINLNDIPWDYLYHYRYQGEQLKELKILINFLLKEPLEFDISLNIKRKNIKKFYLNKKNKIQLGINSWIGEALNDEKIIKSF